MSNNKIILNLSKVLVLKNRYGELTLKDVKKLLKAAGCEAEVIKWQTYRDEIIITLGNKVSIGRY